MDQMYYTRMSLAGWVFAAAYLLGGGWQELKLFLQASGASADEHKLVLGIATAAVGLSGPPAFGFLLEKATALVFTLLGWHFRDSKAAQICDGFSEVRRLLKDEPTRLRGAAFHLALYRKESEELIAWSRRRRSQMYACLSCSLATALGLAGAWSQAGMPDPIVLGTATVAVAILLYSSKREREIQVAVHEVWALLYAKRALGLVGTPATSEAGKASPSAG